MRNDIILLNIHVILLHRKACSSAPAISSAGDPADDIQTFKQDKPFKQDYQDFSCICKFDFAHPPLRFFPYTCNYCEPLAWTRNQTLHLEDATPGRTVSSINLKEQSVSDVQSHCLGHLLTVKRGLLGYDCESHDSWDAPPPPEASSPLSCSALLGAPSSRRAESPLPGSHCERQHMAR